MKHIRTSLSILLCLCLLVTVFAGCKRTETVEGEWYNDQSEIQTLISGEETGGDTEAPGGAAGTTTGGTGGGTTGGTTTGGIRPAVTDKFKESLRGVSVKIWTTRAEKPTRGTAAGDRYYSILSKVAKKYGASIQVVDTTMEALNTSILSGKPQANVITIGDESIAGFLKNNVMCALDSAMKSTGITLQEAWYDRNVSTLMNVNGKQYGFTSEEACPFYIFYNKRLVQAENLEDPYAVYQKGQWNYEKFKSYAERLTKKSSDGKISVDGFIAINPLQVVQQFCYSNGSSLLAIQNGTLVPNLNDTKTIHALDFVADLFHNGIVTYSDGAWDECCESFAQGRSSMILATRAIISYVNDLKLTDTIGLVPVPAGPDAGKSTKVAYSQVFPTFIPTPSTNQAAQILFLMDEVYQENYKNRDRDFESNYKSQIRDIDAYNLFKKCAHDASATRLEFGDFLSYVQQQALVDALQGGSAAQAVSAGKQNIQNAIDDNWKTLKFTAWK